MLFSLYDITILGWGIPIPAIDADAVFQIEVRKDELNSDGLSLVVALIHVRLHSHQHQDLYCTKANCGLPLLRPPCGAPAVRWR
eukprot:3038048-Amphidinium_carterae.1